MLPAIIAVLAVGIFGIGALTTLQGLGDGTEARPTFFVIPTPALESEQPTESIELPPRIAIFPIGGPPGTLASVEGIGFNPLEPVVVEANGQELALGIADDRGAFFDVEVLIPEAQGPLSIQARGMNSDLSADTVFHIAD